MSSKTCPICDNESLIIQKSIDPTIEIVNCLGMRGKIKCGYAQIIRDGSVMWEGWTSQTIKDKDNFKQDQLRRLNQTVQLRKVVEDGSITTNQCCGQIHEETLTEGPTHASQ